MERGPLAPDRERERRPRLRREPRERLCLRGLVDQHADRLQREEHDAARWAGRDLRPRGGLLRARVPSQAHHDAILGITQLLGPRTFVTLNLTWGRATGYLAEPHKFVEKNIEVFTNIFLHEDFGENSPDVRDKGSAFASINHAFSSVERGARGQLPLLRRHVRRSTAHTVEATWLQHLGAQARARAAGAPLRAERRQVLLLQPRRHLDHPGPRPAGGRGAVLLLGLPALRRWPTTRTGCRPSGRRRAGRSSTWRIEQYDMRGRDGVTPQSAYPRAGITTVGVKFIW